MKEPPASGLAGRRGRKIRSRSLALATSTSQQVRQSLASSARRSGKSEAAAAALGSNHAEGALLFRSSRQSTSWTASSRLVACRCSSAPLACSLSPAHSRSSRQPTRRQGTLTSDRSEVETRIARLLSSAIVGSAARRSRRALAGCCQASGQPGLRQQEEVGCLTNGKSFWLPGRLCSTLSRSRDIIYNTAATSYETKEAGSTLSRSIPTVLSSQLAQHELLGDWSTPVPPRAFFSQRCAEL